MTANETQVDVGVAWLYPRVEGTGDLFHSTTGVGRPVSLARYIQGRSTSQELLPDAHSVTANFQDGSLVAMSGRDWLRIDREGRISGPLPIRSGGGGRPAIFGRTVVFRRGDGSLARADMEGGTPVTIQGIVATGPPDFSRDGRTIAVSSLDSEQQPAIETCDLPDCESRRQTIVPNLARPFPPALPSFWRNVRFTPTGDVSYLDGGRTNVWILPRAGGPPYQMTQFEDDRAIADFAWSQDGRLAVSRYVWTNDVVLFKRRPREQ